MPAERNTHARNNNETSNLDLRHRPLAPRHNNSPMAGPQREATPYPSHLQTLEERFTAGVIEMPAPRCLILSFPSQQESDDSSLEFLDEGGFRPPDSSNSDAVVLHQFPGPLDVSQESEATTGSYHVAPAQVFPSSSPMNILSSPNPDSPLAASTNSPTDVSEYITTSEGHSSDPQEFVVYSDDIIQRPSNNVTRYWQSLPFDAATPVQDVDPLERVLPYFPGAYTTTITWPPMGVPIDGNPAFGLRRVSTTLADIL
ncbi:uncharacterized protein FIBRA_09230 [Fibroporia radiculosa]|uniref:Uncharacterized protein n=1 Tax=Fibroporia radiculosa TaxID=599839 RepID=J7SCU5_9APHY|nr:uncharacterized protein FIBRA_09230 [Fibroporia radiculosa]CCM06918.1 predicted protein [Fibroporia radiculosa]